MLNFIKWVQKFAEWEGRIMVILRKGSTLVILLRTERSATIEGGV